MVTDAVLVSQSINFTGSGFPVTSFVAVASFGGVDADTTVVVSSTEVIAKWGSTGVAAISAIPVLRFIDGSNSDLVDFAQNAASVKVTKNLIIDTTAATQTVSCSFQGGCQY